MTKAPKNAIHMSGKRKRAIARATLRKGGSGIIKVNNRLLDHFGTAMLRARILEPMILAGSAGMQVDVSVKVQGGGMMGQADAARLAIARSLSALEPSLRQTFLEYDRQLLVADVRRKEASKPNSHGQARSKTQKSYR